MKQLPTTWSRSDTWRVRSLPTAGGAAVRRRRIGVQLWARSSVSAGELATRCDVELGIMSLDQLRAFVYSSPASRECGSVYVFKCAQPRQCHGFGTQRGGSAASNPRCCMLVANVGCPRRRSDMAVQRDRLIGNARSANPCALPRAICAIRCALALHTQCKSVRAARVSPGVRTGEGKN